jgi:hypothetical protein
MYNLRDSFNLIDLFQGSNWFNSIGHIAEQLVGDTQQLKLHLQN